MLELLQLLFGQAPNFGGGLGASIGPGGGLTVGHGAQDLPPGAVAPTRPPKEITNSPPAVPVGAVAPDPFGGIRTTAAPPVNSFEYLLSHLLGFGGGGLLNDAGINPSTPANVTPQRIAPTNSPGIQSVSTPRFGAPNNISTDPPQQATLRSSALAPRPL